MFPTIPKGFTLCSHNVNHLSNKLDELKLFLECDNPKLDVYALCETFLTDRVHDDVVRVKGYQMIRKDRKYSAGGGIIVYIKNGINYKHRQDLESQADQTIEVLWLELHLSSKTILVAQVYRPPKLDNLFTTNWLEFMEHSLGNAYSENKPIVVMGDFNLDALKLSSFGSKWSEVCSDLGLEQVIKKPTRVTDKVETLIDHVYVSEDIRLLYQSVIDYGISDHLPVLVKLDMKNILPSHNAHCNEIKYRSFQKYNQEAFEADLLNADWPDCSVLTIDEAVALFTSIFKAIIDKHFPQLCKKVKRIKQPGWLNADIRKCIKLRDGSRKRRQHAEYKIYRNLVTTMKNEAKTEYYKKYVQSNRNNPSKLCKLFDELSGKSKGSDIASLNHNNRTLTTDLDIANAFNAHFTSITSQYIPEKGTEQPDFSKLRGFVKSRVPPQNFFKIPLMTERHVQQFIKNLDASKATGIDGIDAKFIKLSGPYIVNILMQICNLSIATGTFPASWKLAKVTPLHKKDTRDDPNNYRPISILPVLSKLLERHVSNNLYEFLTCHDLIAMRQSGFRPKHSCETALHLMVDDWVSHMFQNELVGVLYVDFCKAFDLINHNLLLKKLEMYQIHPDAMAWFTSYLNDRKQCVKVNKSMSDPLIVDTGVPQGSILGPLTFLLGVNDLPLQDSLENLNLFADDATDSACGPDVNTVEMKLKIKANNVNKWCKENHMVLGIDKTKGMLLGSKQKLSTIANSGHCLNIEIDGRKIEQVNSERLLGVQIDNSLKWDDQIKRVKKMAAFKLSMLRKIRKYLPLDVRKMFFNYYIKPHLTYCSSVWGHTTKQNLSKINKIKKQAARLILDKNYLTPSIDMFNELQWQHYAEDVKYQQALVVFKSLNNQAPSYMKNMFQYVKDTGRVNLRSVTDNKLFVPRAHQKTIRSSGPRIWNNLKNEIRSAKSVKAFKQLYRKKM